MRAHSLTVLVAVALMGCASEAPKPKGELSSQQLQFEQQYPGGTLCITGHCSLAVTVGPGCAVSVSPPTLGVDTGVEDAVLSWTIDPSAGAAFTASGIDPKEPGAWNREFRNGTRVSATEFTWIDKNKLPGAPPRRPYAYNVEVTQDGKTCKLDPSIINDY